jgi:hypothetical protein
MTRSFRLDFMIGVIPGSLKNDVESRRGAAANLGAASNAGSTDAAIALTLSGISALERSDR